MTDDETNSKKRKAPPLPVPMTRQGRRAMKRDRLKLIQGGKPPDAPRVDMSQPAGRFAFHLHEFIVRYVVANPDLEKTAACAASLQVSAKFAVELGGNAEEFARAAEHFFGGEEAARQKGPPPEASG